MGGNPPPALAGVGLDGAEVFSETLLRQVSD